MYILNKSILGFSFMENDAFLKKDMLEPLLAKYGKVFKENDILFREGDNSEGKFYILYEGKVKIILDDKGTQTIVNIIEEGEIFVQMAL
jgi:CRP-like cAMP-binding protein